MNKNNGVALIQVLIISFVLSIIGVFILQSLKKQTNTVNMVKGAVSLLPEIMSAEADLKAALLSLERVQNKASFSTIQQRWNFYGKPFLIGSRVQVEMQDAKGLLNLNLLNEATVRAYLLSKDKSEAEIRVFIDSLKDWIDSDDLIRLNGAERHYYDERGLSGPRNGYLQYPAEVLLVKGANILAKDELTKLFTTEITGGLNPFNAPNELLKIFVPNSNVYEEIINLRSLGEITPLKFYQLTGIEETISVNFATGNKIWVKLRVKDGSVSLSKRFLLEVKPLDVTQPVTVSNVVWNQ